MALTAETVARHELVGLEATVTEATNPDLEGATGTVVSETTRTLALEDDRERTVPKDVAQFAFTLPDGASEASASDSASSAERSSADRSSGQSPREDGDEPRATVTVDGDRLVARPARRTETRGDSKWR